MRDNSSNVRKINSKNIRQVALENSMENWTSQFTEKHPIQD